MSVGRKALESATREIAALVKPAISRLFGPRVGFTVFVFDFGAKGNLAYLSTASREDMIASLKLWLAYQEAGLTTDPAGERGTS